MCYNCSGIWELNLELGLFNGRATRASAEPASVYCRQPEPVAGRWTTESIDLICIDPPFAKNQTFTGSLRPPLCKNHSTRQNNRRVHLADYRTEIADAGGDDGEHDGRTHQPRGGESQGDADVRAGVCGAIWGSLTSMDRMEGDFLSGLIKEDAMKNEANLLLGKACDSLVLSVELFNRPSNQGRVNATLIHLDHCFEMFMKAAILARGGDNHR